MADTKLTRETVEMLLETFEDAAHPPSTHHIRSNFDNLAALCRYWLATEQDARDAANQFIAMARQRNEALERAESAESANRALQAEVDRLQRESGARFVGLLAARNYFDGKGCDADTTRGMVIKAIAYTGTEPQEKP